MCSDGRMLSLLQQMCVPAAVDAAEDNEVLHGGVRRPPKNRRTTPWNWKDRAKDRATRGSCMGLGGSAVQNYNDNTANTCCMITVGC